MAYSLSALHQTGVPPLLDGIATREDWERKLAGTRDTWLSYIGGLPERVPVRYQVFGETVLDDHVRIHLAYDTVYGDTVTAYLLVPIVGGVRADAAGGNGEASRLPAMLALHPTNTTGKDDIATYPGKLNRTYAVELVARGYVVLAPDALTAGERIYPGMEPFQSGPFYERHPAWTTVAKNIVDHMQGVDLLATLGYVDAGRIGAIGHSFGSYNAYFLAGFDKRIRAIAASCGVSPFARDPNPWHWGIRASWYTHLPRITLDLERDEVPFDFHEIIALCCPTPYFNYAAQADHIFPHWQSVGEAMVQIAELYEWSGAADRFVSMLGSGGHDFPPLVREMAYSFLDRWLKRGE
ncbi:MAG: prolyl oligopeptidase family serine peptidase [Paenibacillaceae bacterium]|nr:prolyl oligopeptidase family serine peptidase [Paenibacillaceae bacterium]